jgi:hypothetical protein
MATNTQWHKVRDISDERRTLEVEDFLQVQKERIPMPEDKNDPPFEPDTVINKREQDYFPGNSKQAKQNRASRVTTGNVRRKTAPTRHRLKDSLFAEDARGVFDYILHDVLLPAAKSTLSDVVTSGIERLVYGEGNPSPRRDRSYHNYGGYSSSGRRSRYNDPYSNSPRQPREYAVPRRGVPTVGEDIIFERRNDAEMVWTGLLDLIDRYGEATVADFYELVGMTSTHVDYKRGWDSLARATIDRVRNGYILVLPEPINL